MSDGSDNVAGMVSSLLGKRGNGSAATLGPGVTDCAEGVVSLLSLEVVASGVVSATSVISAEVEVGTAECTTLAEAAFSLGTAASTGGNRSGLVARNSSVMATAA